MTVDTLNTIVKAIAMLLSVLLTTVIIPWIKSKISAEKLLEIENYTRMAVRCAEQIFTPDEWKEKKAYVLDYISVKALDIGVEVTPEDIENIIEGCVNEIKKG